MTTGMAAPHLPDWISGEKDHAEEGRMQQRTSAKKLLLLLMGAVVIAAVYILCQAVFTEPTFILPAENSSAFLVYTEGCWIEDLNPSIESIKKYLVKPEAPRCYHSSERLVEADTNSLYINTTVLAHYNISSILDLTCTYTEFWRVEQPLSPNNLYTSSVNSITRYSNRSTQIVNRAFITSEEFVRVECHRTKEKEEIYVDYFAFPQLHEANVVKKEDRPNAVSVLVVGVDSVSRLNLYRQMPQTVDFFKKNRLSFEMLGYTKVGLNTYPNVVAVLNGIFEKEMKNTCWTNVRNVYDNCTFIWEKYKQAGYYTGYAEDSARISIFRSGFRKQPTDFFGHSFHLLAEKELGQDFRLNNYLCIGSRLNIEVILDAAKAFSLRMKEYLSFGFFWGSSISHDYFNLASYGDEAYRALFDTLYKEGVFEKTVVVFLSDHGIRWGAFRETYQGYIEERLPFLFISVPSWFPESFPIAMINLRLNTRRLSTPFDLHETLKDLSDLNCLQDENIKLRSSENTRGISLFSVIPKERTCEDAEISPNWCSCHTSKSVAIDDPRVVTSVNAIINQINDLLKSYAMCAPLKLHRIIHVRQEVSINDIDSDTITDYSVTLQTSPGRAWFDATVQYDRSTENYTVIQPISRINSYGNQSKCISDSLLKLYCYCQNSHT